MDLGLKDKRALVIGASRGLGYATALLLAKEGCRVAINGRDEAKIKAAAEKIVKETGASVFGVAGDVSDPSVPEKIIDQAVKFLGGLDLLVTNAGGPPAGAFESFDEATWEKAVNLSFMSHVRTHPRCTAPFAKIKNRQRADDDIVFRETTAAEFGFIEQRAARNNWLDENSCARTR